MKLYHSRIVAMLPFVAFELGVGIATPTCRTGTSTDVKNWCRDNQKDCCTDSDSCRWTGDAVTVCEGSCKGSEACDFGTFNPSIAVESESCIGAEACHLLGDHSALSTITVGERSCTDTHSCHSAKNNIGHDSCNDAYACKEAEETIGDDSCNGLAACSVATQRIGDESCNESFACHRANGQIGDNSCNAWNACEEATV